MKDEMRRERLSESASLARSAAAENAALSVTAGSMMLGAILSGPAGAADRQMEAVAKPDSGADNVGSVAAEPVTRLADADDARLTVQATAIPPEPGAGQALSETAAPPQHHDASAAAAEAPGRVDKFDPASLAAASSAEATASLQAAMPKVAPAASDAEGLSAASSSAVPPSAGSSSAAPNPVDAIDSSAVEPAVSGGFGSLTAGIGAKVDALLAKTPDMGEMVQPSFSTMGFDQMDDSLTSAVERLLPGRTAQDSTGDVAGSPNSANGSPMDWSAIDSAALSGTILAALPPTLLGAHGEPLADGVFAHSFADSTAGEIPDLQQITISIGDDFAVDPSQPIQIGFLGQSYLELADPHDIGHAGNSLTYGFV